MTLLAILLIINGLCASVNISFGIRDKEPFTLALGIFGALLFILLAIRIMVFTA